MSSQNHGLVLPRTADEPARDPATDEKQDDNADADADAEANAAFTRKRPRLDSGIQARAAISADPASARSSTVLPIEKQLEMAIRSHAPSSPPRAAQEDERAPEPPVLVIGTDDDNADSPPVMVIDAEEDEPVAFAVQLDAEHHFRQFPFACTGNCSLVARELAQHVGTASSIEPSLLVELTQWLAGLPDPSADLQGFYVNKAVFWEDFANLVNKLLLRRYPLGHHFDDLQTDELFYRFFQAYMRLTLFLLLADLRLLSRTRPEDIYPLPLLSHKHIRHLHSVLRVEKAPVLHLLHKDYRVDVHEMGVRLHRDFLLSNGAKILLQLTDQAFHQVPANTQNLIATWSSQIFTTTGQSIFQFPSLYGLHDRSDYYRGVLSFFHQYSKDLSDFSKTTDSGVARDLIQHFSVLISELCQWDEAIAGELANKFLDPRNPESPTSSSSAEDAASAALLEYCQDVTALPTLISNAWKFKLLRKYIVKGKMDMRVMSIAAMDAALVEIWREFSGLDPSCKHPVMQHLADFLLHGQVVNYIISVDSHPQLISRSGNIVGFLIVTHRWSEAQADAIWKTVATNPDHRVVAATMTMLRNIIGLMNASDQLYLCSKFYDLPVDRYTLDILRLLRELTGKLLERSPAVDYSTTDFCSRPWNVCIRMLRDTAPSKDTDKNMIDLHSEASDQLRSLTNVISSDERFEIYRQCMQHINGRTKEATGSVRVIYVFSATVPHGDYYFFQQNPDLTRQIVEEVPIFIRNERRELPYPYQILALRYRVELLALLVCRAGLAVPSDLYGELWDFVIGKEALSNAARDMAWMQLLHTIKISPDNDFCKQLMNSYLPQMDPEFYTSGLFDAVASYNFPLTRTHVETEEGETSILHIPGAELLWSIVLFSAPNTIENSAASLLAARYVQISDAEDVTLSEVEAAHILLVEKCMSEMRRAFSSLRQIARDGTSTVTEMNSTMSDKLQHDEEIRVGRILLFQKLLLEYVRQKPEFNRGRRADSKVDETDIPHRDSITIRYQCGSDRQTITMAADRTLEDLYKRLCHVTGFTKINLFAKGQRLKAAENAAQRVSDIDFGGQLLVQRAEGAETTKSLSERIAGSSVFETTVVKHFDELFALMDSDSTLSKQLFDFLSLFPARTAFVEGIMTGTVSSETLFPAGKFYQARYAAQALLSRLRNQIRSSALNEEFLAKSIRCLEEALLNTNLIGDPISSFQELQLAAVLVNVLLEFLRERPSANLSAGYFSHGSRLADRLLKILGVALETNDDAAIVQDSFAAVLEASLHSRLVWESFVGSSEIPHQLSTLLLTDQRRAVRECIAKKITSVCGGDLPLTCPLTKREICTRFWSIISVIIPDSVLHPEHAQQLFEIAEHVFRANGEIGYSEETLRALMTQWSSLLMRHKHQEFVGREETDYVVLGFTRLIRCCTLFIKSLKISVNPGTLMEDIFRKYLFAQRSQELISAKDDKTAQEDILPVLDSVTRQELYSLMLALIEDRNTYKVLLQLAAEAETDDCDPVMATISVDRTMEIRSSTGYVGLYNPRAICYMNSLMTQLFMNVNFRQFMLGLEVQEASGSQKLLFETQRLFTQMQHSFRRSIDPRGFAACVKNLEQMPIDVSIQMDADEFYNLLFDQWEAQLVKEQHKQQFRSFYGGQTLNQIKSKECEHVSERAEPFFALQCDVQGKANLRESLQAFVRGDVMEGDNKYKCESCGGKFVDAVKRTCLKEVPDNLIFHLKRFEFDLNDFSRRKIYDYFEFPSSIDVNEYHVDHLSDPSKPCGEDIFDLVGVLVHTGNCENGHYYSYIRERPSLAENQPSQWVEFDDSNVGPFDPADIAQKAFGGSTEDIYGRQMKNYSAYMLFYQRRAALEKDQERWIISTKKQTSKASVPNVLRDEVDATNALFLREYSLFDLSHSKFVRQLLTASITVNHGNCSEDHEQETRLLHFVLSHLSQIVWRHQNPDVFTEILTQLRRPALTCSTCCSIILRALSADEYAFVNLILRCIHPQIRAQSQALVVDCLMFLRDKEPGLYGTGDGESDMELDSAVPVEGVLVLVVKRLRIVANETYLGLRGWENFYVTLSQIAELGYVEMAVLLNHGFLEFCLKLVSMHVHQQFKEELYELARILDKRKGIYNKMIGFLATLLLHMDIRIPVIPLTRSHDRLASLDREGEKFPLTQREKNMLLYWSTELKAIATLDKILELFDLAKVEYFYPGDIVKWMLKCGESQVQMNLAKTIVEGISLEPPYCDTYISAGLAFCQACPVPENIAKVIGAVSKAIGSTARMEEERAPNGEVLLDFFSGLLQAQNMHLFERKHNIYAFHYYLMAKSCVYAIPLLVHNMESVRKGAHCLLRELYDNANEMPPEVVQIKYKSMRDLVVEMTHKIVYEKDAGMIKSLLNPLIVTCQMFVQLLWSLTQDEDEDVQVYKDANDSALVYEYQTELEPRLRTWPQDEGTPPSQGDAFEQSDYGSESDDANELLDI